MSFCSLESLSKDKSRFCTPQKYQGKELGQEGQLQSSQQNSKNISKKFLKKLAMKIKHILLSRKAKKIFLTDLVSRVFQSIQHSIISKAEIIQSILALKKCSKGWLQLKSFEGKDIVVIDPFIPFLNVLESISQSSLGPDSNPSGS